MPESYPDAAQILEEIVRWGGLYDNDRLARAFAVSEEMRQTLERLEGEGLVEIDGVKNDKVWHVEEKKRGFARARREREALERRERG